MLISGSFWLLVAAWRVLYAAQRTHTLAITKPYAHIRHLQYVGFVLFLLGFLVPWLTLHPLAMFPVLTDMYVRRARREGQGLEREFGKTYARARTPALIPRFGAAHPLQR